MIRRLGLVLIALLVVGGAVPAAQADTYEPPYLLEDLPASYQLQIAPNYWCAHPDPSPYLTCATTLTASTGSAAPSKGVYYDIDGYLTNLATGAAVPLGTSGGTSMYASDADNHARADTVGQLAPGVYELTMDWYKPGYWSCSQYNPNGCTFLEANAFTVHWKFNYDGKSTATVAPWFSPKTAISGVRVKPTRGLPLVVGRVVERVEQADFSLTPIRPAAGRQLVVQGLKGAKWRNIAKGHTKPNGKIKLKMKFPKWAQTRPSRVIAIATTTAPAAISSEF